MIVIIIIIIASSLFFILWRILSPAEFKGHIAKSQGSGGAVMESVRWAQAVSQDSAAQREMKDFHSQSYRRVINGEECERSIETRSEVI